MFSTYTRCKKKTEAYKRSVFEELPGAFCIQMLRFSNEGRKVKTFVKYSNLLKVQQVQSEIEDVEVITEEEYHLVAVISHHGSSITSGHYTACVLRDDQWYSLNDSQVLKMHSLQ